MPQTYRADRSFSQDYVRFLLTKYLKNWHWFVLAVVGSLLVTYVVLATIKPVYSVQASVLISSDEANGASPKEDILRELDMFSPNRNIDDEIEILRSYTLAERVVTDLELDVTYSVQNGLHEQDIFSRSPISITLIDPAEAAFGEPVEVTVAGNGVKLAGATYPFDRPVNTPLGRVLIRRNPKAVRPYASLLVTTAAKADVVQAYVDQLAVTQASRSSNVLRVRVENTSIERGTAFVNQLVQRYDRSSLDYKNRTAASTLRFINDRLTIISRELTQVEQAIQNYKTRAGIVDLSAESTVFLEKVGQNDTQLNQVIIQLGALDEIEQYIASKPGRESLAPATPGLESPVLTGLLGSLFELEMQREKLIRSAPEGSTAVQVLDNQIRLTKANITDNAHSLRKVLLNTRAKLQASSKRIESIIQTIPGKERVLLDISRQQGIKGGLYTYLLQKREETALSLAATVSDLRIVDYPKGDARPVKPRRRAYYLFALVVGLLVPVAVLWLLDFFNNKLTHKAEIEAVTKVPIIGEIVQAAGPSPGLVGASGQSLIAEQIRALRANLQFFAGDDADGPQTILITSSVSGEGKSFIALNLSASVAITGRRVILLELDLRKPKLHMYLGVEAGQGLSNFLVGRATLEQIIQPVAGYPDLFFIPCGPLPPNPSELLGSKRMGELFAALREGFDVIIADTPPIGLVSDAFSLARHASLTLYILRHLYTNRAYLNTVESLYGEKRFPNLSVLINGIIAKKEYEYNYGYGYDSAYGYGYRAGYHAKESVPPKNVTTKGFRVLSWFKS